MPPNGSPVEPARVRQEHEAAPTAPGPRRGRRMAMIALPFVLVVWIVAALALVAVGRANLLSAEEGLRNSRTAVEDLDLTTVSEAVSSAHEDLSTAADSLTNPLLAPALILPIVGDDLRAVRALAARGAEVTGSAVSAFDLLATMPDGLDGLAPDDGRFPVNRYAELAPAVRAVADSADAALNDIEASPASGRFAQVVDARERVLELLQPMAEQAESAAALVTELPRLLGSDGPRTYLFGAATPSELRGTGGFIGSVALLRVEEGELEFGTFEASSALPTLPPTQLPPPVEEDRDRWSRYGGTGTFVNLNRTPDFPSAARAMLSHWKTTRDDDLDGMIVVDPFAFENLIELSGPVDVPDYGVTLDADSVVAFVANEAYGTFDGATERKEVLGEVAAATFGRFLEGDLDVPATAVVRQFAELIAGGHLTAYSTDPATQEALSRAGVTGELGAGDGGASGDLVAVVLNSGTASKVDYFAQREIDLQVTLLEDGSSRAEMVVAVTNDAPSSGEVKYVIGPNNPTLEAGDNLVDVSVYLAPTARFTEVPPPADGPTFTETALGHPVHDGWVRIPSGTSTERRYAWRTTDAWIVTDDNELAYDLLVQGQTVIVPTRLSIRIDVPDGLEVASLPEGARIEGSTLRWEDDIRGDDVHLSVRFTRPPET